MVLHDCTIVELVPVVPSILCSWCVLLLVCDGSAILQTLKFDPFEVRSWMKIPAAWLHVRMSTGKEHINLAISWERPPFEGNHYRQKTKDAAKKGN